MKKWIYNIMTISNNEILAIIDKYIISKNIVTYCTDFIKTCHDLFYSDEYKGCRKH